MKCDDCGEEFNPLELCIRWRQVENFEVRCYICPSCVMKEQQQEEEDEEEETEGGVSEEEDEDNWWLYGGR